MHSICGNIFDIQGFSVHDGPGARTLIFLNGCSMDCKWCSNPEGKFSYPIPMYSSCQCVHDGDCAKACPDKAISIVGNLLKIDRKKCQKCEEYFCAKACCSGALRISGYRKSLDDVIKIIKRDRQYWGENGGVTLTGGEPFIQRDFVLALLKRCKTNYIHTAIETCGNIPPKNYETALDYIDWIFFDIKNIDPEKHKSGTGVDNKLIIENIRNIAEKFPGELVFRMVVIPGYNDSETHGVKLAKFLSSLPRKNLKINLLPLHHLGRSKYEMLGLEYPWKNLDAVKPKTMNSLKKIFARHKIKCYLGSETPF